MSKFSPKIDLVFRKLFGSEENTDLLLSLLNGIIDGRRPLTQLTLKNPYNLASYVDSKTSILDIKAVDEDGVGYDIEMQICEYHFYGKRAMYYLSKMYVDQLQQGMGYSELNKTIGIHLIDFNYFDDMRYRRHFVFKEMETNEYVEQLSYQQLYFIELSKFRNDNQEVSTVLDRWITFLNKAQLWDIDNIPPTLRDDPTLVKAVGKLDAICFNEAEREIYEAELKVRLDEKEKLRTAIAKGLEEGEAIGLEKGREQGREEGIRQTASNLLREGLPLELIAQYTGLSVDEIELLRQAQ